MAFVNFFSCNDPQFLEESLLCNFIEITLRHGCSPVNLMHVLRTPFLKKTSGRLLLDNAGFNLSLSSWRTRHIKMMVLITLLTISLEGKNGCWQSACKHILALSASATDDVNLTFSISNQCLSLLLW